MAQFHGSKRLGADCGDTEFGDGQDGHLLLVASRENRSSLVNRTLKPRLVFQSRRSLAQMPDQMRLASS